MPLEKSAISTSDAPAAIGPYSQAIRIGDTVFTSGQIPIDPATGDLVPGGIEAQTTRVCENLKAVLAAAGLTSPTSSRPPSSSRAWPTSPP